MQNSSARGVQQTVVEVGKASWLLTKDPERRRYRSREGGRRESGTKVAPKGNPKQDPGSGYPRWFHSHVFSKRVDEWVWGYLLCPGCVHVSGQGKKHFQ